MTDEHRLRIQTSTTLSTGLIAAAFALIAGLVAGLASTADKIPSWAFGLVVAASFVAIACLVTSIFFGGRGMQASGEVLTREPPVAALPLKFDRGNFRKQAMCGLTGLLMMFGLTLLIGYSINEAKRADVVTLGRLQDQVTTLKQALDDLRRNVDSIHQAQRNAGPEVTAAEPIREQKRNKQ